MAIPRLKLVLLLAFSPACVWASGSYDQEPPPTLPYYLGRLPAKPPALIFQETFSGATAPARPVDFKAGLLSLAAGCEAGQPAAALQARVEDLLAQARLHPWQAAARCNLLNDFHDLFAAPAPVTGGRAADYIRWRVAHAESFQISWDEKPPRYERYRESGEEARAGKTAAEIEALVDGSRGDPLHVHWLFLRAACDYPRGGAGRFQAVIDEAPGHPRAEVARFMIARAGLAASRSHTRSYEEPTPAQAAAAAQDREASRASFADYLRRYPHGRFAADVPGWLGALAFDEKDYLGALEQYIRQADVPGHPEVLKSAGFMCERCLARLDDPENHAALQRIAEHPRLAMSLVYLLVNATEAHAKDLDDADDPAQLTRWRRTILPLLAAAVAGRQEAYAGAGWQPRYLAILAQAASGQGDQATALALCETGDFARSDDLAFIRLVALSRAGRLPEAIAAGREFTRAFPRSALAPGATLRLALALQDHHEAGAAVGELLRLKRALAAEAERVSGSGEDGRDDSDASEVIYPSADANLSASRSVLRSDASGAESAQIAQLIDTLLNFAPLPELAAATGLDGGDESNLRATLVQRYLAEEENFAEARKYATPAQWDVAAAGLEKLTAAAARARPGEARAAAFSRLAQGWAGLRGRLIFSPLETDAARRDLFAAENERAGIRRRENGRALGLPAEAVDRALSRRDEWQHAMDAWLKAADAAPPGSPARARALWAALRAMPSIALASPYAFLRAGETDASAASRRLYDRLRRECPASREAREFAVYYDLAPPPGGSGPEATTPGQPPEPDLSAALGEETLADGEPEYRFRPDGNPYGSGEATGDPRMADEVKTRSLALGGEPGGMAAEVRELRERLRGAQPGLSDMYLVNFLDDLADFLQEPSSRSHPAAVARYVSLRKEMLSVEHWGGFYGSESLPPVPGATEDNLNETVLGHIRAAYREPEMAPFKDYLDFLVLAVVANSKVVVTIPGEMQDAKDLDEPGKQEPATYVSRDYPKLARLAEGFLRDYPRSRKREAARLLYARGLYAASRPRVRERFAVWPESGHFGSGRVIVTHRQQPFEPARLGAALNASDREFPQGRYAGDIRNLRGLLAWRTQDWARALDLTLQTLGDEGDRALQAEAGRRLGNIFLEGLADETERARCLAAIRARPAAAQKLRDFLSGSPYPFRTMRSWLLAHL